MNTRSIVERTLTQLLGALEQVQSADTAVRSGGWLQGFDPRVKLVGVGMLIVAVVAAQRIGVIAAILAAGTALALLSNVSWRRLATAWFGALLFTGAIALPAIFLVPGRTLATLPGLDWAISERGLHSALLLIARSETTLTLCLLLVFTTPWSHLLRALRTLRVPVVVVVLAAMTYRYILLLLETASDMFQARRSRIVGRMEPHAQRHLMAASVGVLLDKSLQLSGDVHLAMQARGYRGEVYLLDDFQMRMRDWAGLAGFALAGALALAGGR